MARLPDPEKRLDLARRASVILEREGLSLSAERLAAELGVKRPTLLYHFPTYGHIVEATLVALLVEQAQVVMTEVSRHEHPIDRLYAQLRAVHAFHHGREARIVFLSQAIAATAGARVTEVLRRGTEVFEANRRAAADRVREGIAAGLVVPCDADALVATVRALIDGLMLQRVTSGMAFGPPHELVWERFLRPLKVEPQARRDAPKIDPGGVDKKPRASLDVEPQARGDASKVDRGGVGKRPRASSKDSRSTKKTKTR